MPAGSSSPVSSIGGPPPLTRRVEVGGGVGLHCLEWEVAPAAGGDGAQPLGFLLVHGLASNCRTWEAVGGLLATQGHPVAAVDQRGHGRSDKPGSGYDFATLCDDLEDVLDELGYDRAVVVGQSTGGNIAVDLARRVPDRLAGVAGVDGGTLELQERWPEWDACAAALAPPRLVGTPVEVTRAQLIAAHPDWDDWGIEATLANLEVLDDGAVQAHLSRGNHMVMLRALWEHRPSRVLADLKVPAMFVLADSGDAWSKTKKVGADRAEDLLQAGQVHWLPGDHDLHVQQPENLVRLLEQAVDEGFWK